MQINESPFFRTPSQKQRALDETILKVALTWAKESKDPSTKVGAVLVDADYNTIGTGYNGFPRGVVDLPARWNDRDVKLKLVVHAEMNAVLAAAKRGTATRGTRLYVAATNASGDEVWGGPPCTRCTVECMQAGIVEYISRPFKNVPSRWLEDIQLARQLIAEAGLKFREVPFPEPSEMETYDREQGIARAVELIESGHPDVNDGIRDGLELLRKYRAIP